MSTFPWGTTRKVGIVGRLALFDLHVTLTSLSCWPRQAALGHDLHRKQGSPRRGARLLYWRRLVDVLEVCRELSLFGYVQVGHGNGDDVGRVSGRARAEDCRRQRPRALRVPTGGSLSETANRIGEQRITYASLARLRPSLCPRPPHPPPPPPTHTHTRTLAHHARVKQPIGAAGEASGGFMANVKVGGTVKPGSQQQWFTRDSTMSSVNAGVWNMVCEFSRRSAYVRWGRQPQPQPQPQRQPRTTHPRCSSPFLPDTGVEGAPASHCGSGGDSGPVTTVKLTPRISEKPFITFDQTSGKYSLQIPRLKTGSSGADHDGSGATSVPFEQVYVSDPKDTASALNAKLAQGLHVVLSPGICRYSCGRERSVSTTQRLTQPTRQTSWTSP